MRLPMDYRSVRVEGDSLEPSSQRANHHRSIDRQCSSILIQLLAVQREPVRQAGCLQVLSSARDGLRDQAPHRFVDWL
jgi:hypothetical protein